MKLLFLDFDGVISTFEKGNRLDIEKVQLVEEIIKQTDCKIIVSSDWAKDNKTSVDFIKETFSEKFINEHFDFVYAIIGITNHHLGYPKRGDEIEHYLTNFKTNLESYVILDDINDFNDNQLFNFVQTDTYEGITSREVKLAIAILNNKKVIAPMRLNDELKIRWYTKNNGGPDKISALLLDYHHRKFF